MQDKPEYKAPELTEIGSFEEITQAVKNKQTTLDLNYPATTPFPDLTWT